MKKQAEDVDLFSDDEVEEGIQPISHEDYERLIEYLKVTFSPTTMDLSFSRSLSAIIPPSKPNKIEKGPVNSRLEKAFLK